MLLFKKNIHDLVKEWKKNIKIIEKSGMRKDRYSSLAYNYWCINQIIRKKKPKTSSGNIASLLASQTKKSTRKIGMFNK